jgi:hypothetical protein
MAKTKKSITEPVIVRGSHSTRTEYPDGRVEFVTHWDELVRDVQAALSNVEQPAEEKIKKTRSKKKS